jgi:hypothetical protein
MSGSEDHRSLCSCKSLDVNINNSWFKSMEKTILEHLGNLAEEARAISDHLSDMVTTLRNTTVVIWCT